MPRDIASWARNIKSLYELPDEFREPFDSFSSKADEFPYTIYAPPMKWGTSRKINGKLISATDDGIFYLEKEKNEIIGKEFQLKDINYIEHGTILLYSWIKVVGIAAGETGTATVEFNTVVEDLFLFIIRHVRRIINGIVSTDEGNERHAIETGKFDCLSRIDFKLMNYSISSIMRGQTVNCFAYQPMIYKKYLKLIRRVRIFPRNLILTDKELIIIKDEEKQSRDRYGGIHVYIPLARIGDMSVDFDPRTRFFVLHIEIPGGEGISLEFSSVDAGLERLVNEFCKQGRLREHHS